MTREYIAHIDTAVVVDLVMSGDQHGPKRSLETSLEPSSSCLPFDFTAFINNEITRNALTLKCCLEHHLKSRKNPHLEYSKGDENDEQSDLSAKRVCLTAEISDGQEPQEDSFKPHSQFESSADIYEAAVYQYRKLRNEVHLLTDAAYDIEATTAPTRRIPYFEIPSMHGPLIKRAPPGRGRRKNLSTINTPLPATILTTFEKHLKGQQCESSVNILNVHRPRILFIDDSVITLRLTAKRFQAAGFLIETVASGIDALDLLINKKGKYHSYDIVLIDIHMPVMSGPEVAIALRKHEDEVRKAGGIIYRHFVIGTSCDTSKHLFDQALAAGMDAFLAKPFTPSDLQLFLQPKLKDHE